MIDFKCPACRLDDSAIVKWRIDGGPMPMRVCSIDHRPTCKCGKRHEGRKSGVCDTCWELQNKSSNHVISPGA
jgi:hypothetical protein